MERIKKIEQLGSSLCTIYNNELSFYSTRGALVKSFIVKEIKDTKVFYDNMLSIGFDKLLCSKDYKLQMLDATVELFEEAMKDSVVVFYKRIESSDITSFYHLEIEIEIKGKRISRFYRSHDNASVRFDYCDDVHKFGDPYLLEIFGQRVQGGLEPRVTEFKVPVSKIDKFIAVKRYKDCEWLGTAREKEFNGIEEEIVLDMHNFDDAVYQIFKDHGVLELSW